MQNESAGTSLDSLLLANAKGLTDQKLSPAARQAAAAVAASLCDRVGRRAAGVFLGLYEYQIVENLHGVLEGPLMLECLPRFVREAGGEVAYAARFDHAGIGVPVQSSVSVDGETRVFLRDGYLFIQFAEERVVVSANPVPVVDGYRYFIGTRSNVSSSGFMDRWRGYCKKHNYLRGKAFFADGDVIHREKKYDWSNIILSPQIKETIRTHVENFLANRARLRGLGLKARRGIILSGPPGTGKTLLGKVLADQLDVSFIWVSPRHVKYAGSFQGIMEIARMVAPAVVFLEDLDLFGEERDNGSKIELGELMNQLDGALDNEDIITIATTNRLDVIEKALRNRPGRFDRIIEMNGLDETCRRRLLDRLLAKAAIEPDDFGHLVHATEDYTGAQVEELANTLYILAVSDDNIALKSVSSVEPTGDQASADRVAISRQVIDVALSEVRVDRKVKLGFHAA